MQSSPAETVRAAPVLLGLGCIWGASFLFIKVLVDETGPMEVALGRLGFGALIVIAYALLARRPMPKLTPGLIARVSVVSLIATLVPFSLIAAGEEHIDSGTASILNATMPIFTSVFAAILLTEEHLTPARLGGLLLGFIGVGVLTGDDVFNLTDADVLGELAVVGAAACYGIGAVLLRNILRTGDPVSITVLQVNLAALYSVPVTFAVTGGTPNYDLSLEAWGSLLGLGLFGTGVAYILYNWLIENTGSVRASLVTYIVPVIAVVLGWIVLDESIGLNTVAGGLLIIAGVASVMRGQAPGRRQAVAVAGVPASGE
jgi:drug/metabolite transporter (DMT)-like permease